jgi:signal transduction histidine kinase
MPSTPPPLRADHWLRRFLKRGLRVGVIAVAASMAINLAMRHDFWPSLAYSTCIALSCWFFIDGGHLVAARWTHRAQPDDPHGGHWPGWPWMVFVVLAGTALGYSVGNALGNWVTGFRNPGLADMDNVRDALSLLLVSLIPALAFTYFFHLRGHLATVEALAQTAQRQAAENQLKLLESQLEPHMLFNTLANLRVLIGIDPPRAQAMLDQLIAFLRATLEASRSGSHALASEFKRIADYLDLMQIRMGARLQTELVLPSELAEQPVPPLLLQPLVENAIKHGLEPHVEGGRLRVSAHRDGDTLVLQVRDTGEGLSGPPGDGTRFGLQQVRDRLATLHGKHASLELAEAHDAQGGTLATIRLPIQE